MPSCILLLLNREEYVSRRYVSCKRLFALSLVLHAYWQAVV